MYRRTAARQVVRQCNHTIASPQNRLCVPVLQPHPHFVVGGECLPAAIARWHGSSKAKQKASEWLTKVGLGHRLASRPDQLSAGQQQRVAIARALIADPVLMLADETTGNLDTKSSDDIAALLMPVAKEWGRSVLMVTHDPHIAARADRIVFLKDGKIVNETQLESEHTDNAESV